MRYQHTFAESAEFLRLALPLMSRQKAALHPLSYALWYEHVSGMNKALSARLEALTAGGGQLDEEDVATLYRDYIAEVDEATAQRISADFERVMANISASTAHAAERAGHFGRALKELATAPEEVAIQKLDHLLEHSHAMRSVTDKLQSELDESRREIDRLRQEVRRAREESWLDGLTGLANRRRFDQVLAASLAEGGEPATGLCLLLADIDHFKKINDTFGHLFGDKVLRTVAGILRDNVKGRDLAARYGGEEFAIILPQTPLSGARHVAENIRQRVAAARIRRIGSDEVVGNITLSIGIACRLPGESDEALIARADAALYEAKQNGRNRVCLAPNTNEEKLTNALTARKSPLKYEPSLRE